MSLAVQFHKDHKAIHQRIAAAAEAHKARKQGALVAALKECGETKPKPEPAPEPIEDGWVEQQITKHKPLWFTVVRSIKLNRLGGPPIKEIQLATCEVYGVEMVDLLSDRRTADIVLPRMVSIYLAKKLTSLSLNRIGMATGDRDHTTIIHAIRKIEREIKSNEKLASTVALIRERLS